MIKEITDMVWDREPEKRRHSETSAKLSREFFDLSDEVSNLRSEIEAKRHQVAWTEERRRLYNLDCQKLDYLTRHDRSAARELIGRMATNYRELVECDSSFERRVRAFLEAETRDFQRRLGEVVI